MASCSLTAFLAAFRDAAVSAQRVCGDSRLRIGVLHVAFDCELRPAPSRDGTQGLLMTVAPRGRSPSGLHHVDIRLDPTDGLAPSIRLDGVALVAQRHTLDFDQDDKS
jgi:hypothetical protein